MSNDLISVIIPLYNCEKYIKRCVESILNQTYLNIEVIIVNDGSKDNSLQIVKDLYENENKIKIYDKINTGVADTRNFGLKKCKGKYIVFVDADDWVDNQYIELLHKQIVINRCDASSCSFVRVRDGINNLEKNGKSNCNIFSRSEVYQKMITNNFFGGYCWNKMYKKSVLSKLDYAFDKNLNVCEDYEFNCRYFSLCDSVSYIDLPLYKYYMNNQSITSNSKINLKFLSILEAYKLIINEYNKNAPEYVDYVYLEQLKILINLKYRYSKEKKFFSHKNDIIFSKVMKSNYIGIKSKIIIIIRYYFPILSARIYSMLSGGKK